MMEIVLTAVDENLANAWAQFCGDLDGVRIHRGSIFEVPSDAVVGPANSFGFMDGGIDALYVDRWGSALQDRVRHAIKKRHHGELLVGAADIVETGGDVPYLIVAPIMRVPTILENSVNSYLAARAAFLLVQHGIFPDGPSRGHRIDTVVRRLAVPGLGTGVGQIGANTCAWQVRCAFEHVFLGQHFSPRSWAEASAQHQALFTSRPTRLQG